ncbi:histidine kinase [Streptomyces filamentosus]|uniref:histidine kinase n=2 Tax=Streptomyces filamentosus TaxID=67294 RepID=A0ABY4UVN5_STRFL|nr:MULTISPECIES: histidine kinase [Streptomyces]MYR80313.1 two-component sensor histidine kinase [Streptomyces sp. SID5466]EFE76326.1 two-component system sensor kinase [Streptomyces filamentosus NRRL 15998]ESU49545.1 putative two-component system sensor kinase [Streptomyces sp. HCCB10043]EWS93306.1 two-component system sensor kinase [Streptomyces filamentosus NRRL 11379]USC48159.1 histidine kinase [Streptomyces filamentosus]
MTETQTKNSGPEFRAAAGALDGLREDLFRQAFAYRPLPPMSADGRLIRRLPEGLRRGVVWTPHALVLFAAFIVMMTGFAEWDYRLLMGVVPAIPVAMTLIRPVAAFWASLLATVFCGILSSELWGASPFMGQVVVLVVVAARTRPRTAAWMWLLTLLFGMLVEGGDPSITAPLATLSAFALLVVAVVQIRRDAEREVTVQRTVTAVERDRRTLLEERTTIARELHDVVAHHMSVVAIQAEAAPYRVENPPPELEQAFVTIRENAVAALTELRRVLGVVRAEDYEAPDAPQPTLAALDGLLDNVRETGLETEKVITGAVRELPQGVELSAYRIVQEALSNSLRHAPGSTARVELGYVLGGLGLRVVNGPPQGLVKPSPGAGHGITGMRERVAMLNGEMTAGTTADGGYEVAVFLPVPLSEQPERPERPEPRDTAEGNGETVVIERVQDGRA